MKRTFVNQLALWKNSPDRKPAVVQGARQIGKTYSVKQFGKLHFDNTVYVNFENDALSRAVFSQNLSPREIILKLEQLHTATISAGSTLIFLDEIQTCPEALQSLKYFNELTPEYHIICAGSLLGVAINRESFSFPVGKVTTFDMFPMDFEEFLVATGKQFLAEEIKAHFITRTALASEVHSAALSAFKDYLIVGGMPEVVQHFLTGGNTDQINSLQREIVNNYQSDMSKYASASDAIKIRACFNSIPTQLAKENQKFQYKLLQKGGTSSIFGNSIEWLVDAGIAIKCQKLSGVDIPLNAFQDYSSFKLFMNDPGLLGCLVNVPYSDVMQLETIDRPFLGALMENYIAGVLKSKRLNINYWESEGKAELDFVLQYQGEIVPVEVKKGVNTKAKSLKVFVEKYRPPYSIRFTAKNFGFENNIFSCPLYAAWCL